MDYKFYINENLTTKRRRYYLSLAIIKSKYKLKNRHNMRLSKFINKFIFSIAFISTSLAFLVSILFQYSNLEKDKQYIKNEFIQEKKNDLQREIESVFKLIEHEELVLQRIKDNFKESTNIEKIEKETQDEILKWLASYKIGENGYVFVNNLDNKALVWDGKKLEIPMEYPSETLYQKQLNAVKNPSGGFMFYKFKKPDTVKEFEKVAFVKEYKKYKWIIGTGTYLDDVEKELARREAIFKNSIENQIKSLLLLFVFILIGVYIITKKLSKYIKTNIKNLTISFEKASRENKKVDTNNLTYKEFISLANNLNMTLENKNLIERELQDYINLVNEHIIISSTNVKGVITDVNKAFCNISGYTKEELIGKTHQIIRHPDTPESFYKEMWDILVTGKEWMGEIKNIDKNKKDYWVQAVIKPVYKNTEIVGFTALRTNITDKKYIEQLSITDELTKLYNRRFFNTKIEDEINRAKRENNYFSLLILDIDYFKEFNDTYGHQEGDIALEKVSAVLKNFTNRSSDFAFRLGGEEFGIITTLDKTKVLEFANHIKNEIENLKIEHKPSSISDYLTISIGITSKKSADISNSNTLYKEADDALYKAKKDGRNCISIQE
jgi:diguanylate cyclase (GGDEF)-like protein/PAS domain S-box-containing protein